MNARRNGGHAAGLLALCSIFAASTAAAHVCMDAPTSRVGAGCNFLSEQKVGPCGVNQRCSKVTEFRPGETITVKLNETIDHPSHYRIAFNPNGDAFEDPTSKDDKNGGHPFVLLDNITDDAAAQQSIKVTLPNMTCDKCTLQLIQVMYDKGGNGFGGDDGEGGKADNDDLYYACADLVLKGTPVSGDAGTPAPADAGAVDAAVGVEAGAVLDASIGTTDASADASVVGGTAGGTGGLASGGGTDAGPGAGALGGASNSPEAGAATGGTTTPPPAGTGGGALPGDDADGDGGCSVAFQHGRSRGMAWLGLGVLAVSFARRRRRV
jgi:MYXO-CTERM domain-containing protein